MAQRELLKLQDRCRRDPGSYERDFLGQCKLFSALTDAAKVHPASANEQLAALSSFLAHVAEAYPEHSRRMADTHIQVLESVGTLLAADVRRSLVRSLCIMHKKQAVDTEPLVALLLRLLTCNDKRLRRTLHERVVFIVRDCNRTHRNEALNRRLQALAQQAMEGNDALLAKRVLLVVCELFRRRIWSDDRAANMAAELAFHDSLEVSTVAVHFLLTSDEPLKKAANSNAEDDDDNNSEESDSDTDSEGDDKRRARQAQRIGVNVNSRAGAQWKLRKATGKKSTRQVARARKKITKARPNRSAAVAAAAGDATNPLSAIMLIHDPQMYAERLFRDLQTRRKHVSFTVRLQLLSLITRLIRVHELLLLNVYPYLQRYMQPHQDSVTQLLAYLSQACHRYVPPEVLQPLVRTLADNFVSDRCSEMAMTVGLNAIRAICMRVPEAIEATSDPTVESSLELDADRRAALLQDLVQYKSHRDRGVSMAARSLTLLYRTLNPAMLPRRDRGREAAFVLRRGGAAGGGGGGGGGGVGGVRYGQNEVASTVEGVELLEASAQDSALSVDEEALESLASIDEEEDGSDGDEEDGADEDVVDGEGEDCDTGDDAEVGEAHDEAGSSEPASTRSSSEDDENAPESEDSDEDLELGEGSAANDGSVVRSDAEADNTAAASTSMKPSGGLNEATTRILTDEDFRRIRRGMSSGQRDDTAVRRALKRARSGGEVRAEDLEALQTRQRRTLEERLESVRAGREERPKFGSKKSRRSKTGGLSNREKRKSKPLSMMLPKVRRRKQAAGKRGGKGNRRRRS